MILKILKSAFIQIPVCVRINEVGYFECRTFDGNIDNYISSTTKTTRKHATLMWFIQLLDDAIQTLFSRYFLMSIYLVNPDFTYRIRLIRCQNAQYNKYLEMIY